MTVRTGICVLVVAASVAWAQDSPMSTINGARRLVKDTSTATEQSHVAVGNSNGKNHGQNSKANSTAPVAPKKTAAKRTSSTQKKASASPKKASAPASGSEEPEAEGTPNPGTENSGVHNLRGRRDPFMTVIRSQTVEVGCANGKKCLDVGKIDLKGIVRSQNGMIAVVENQQKKTYFLHENDPVYKGHVVKINSDSVVFRQVVADRLGKQSTKDVVKHLFRSAV